MIREGRPSTHSFADVAHQSLLFDTGNESGALILELVDNPWVQRLRDISQTGNTKLVYMFAEHSRFGHSLGVAYLANLLMENLSKFSPQLVNPYRSAISAAALLHDIGHVAPGSHLAERVWMPDGKGKHETVTLRVLRGDDSLRNTLANYSDELPELVCRILAQDPTLPEWTTAVISGGGWNADRGNWAMVDSAMCSVTYGRYNVSALVDAFRLTEDGCLVLRENRLDALTHFFVARDSMYRQVYQHRVLQAVDALTGSLVLRLRDLIAEVQCSSADILQDHLKKLGVFADNTMLEVLCASDYSKDLSLNAVFRMTESWWNYHVQQWGHSKDSILGDLARRLRNRHLLKTMSLSSRGELLRNRESSIDEAEFIEQARTIAQALGYDPRYYVRIVDSSDTHRSKPENPPMVLLDNNEIVPVTSIEPMIAQIMERPEVRRTWLAVPKKVKEKMGRHR